VSAVAGYMSANPWKTGSLRGFLDPEVIGTLFVIKYGEEGVSQQPTRLMESGSQHKQDEVDGE
jgi:hypothetical protein